MKENLNIKSVTDLTLEHYNYKSKDKRLCIYISNKCVNV